MKEIKPKENELIVATGISNREAIQLSKSTNKIVVMLEQGQALETLDIQTAKKILNGIIQSESETRRPQHNSMAR